MAYLNYNVALLKTIREPLLEGLTPVRDALLAVVSGTLSADQIQAKGAIEAAGNLQMVGRPSLVLSLRTLSSVLTRLSNEYAQWEPEKVVEVARTGAALVDQVIHQIRAAERGQPAGARDLMRAWSALAAAAGAPAPTPADLFDGDADIDASRFSAMDAQILRETAVPHLEKFTAALGVLRAPVQEGAWSTMLSDMEEVFDWACAVRHRLGFHAYWCAARARIAWEALSGFPGADPVGRARLDAFSRAMQQASLELRKFSEDARRTRPDSLLELMRPLLAPWPKEWTSRRQALSDVVTLFNLTDFWKQTDEGSRPVQNTGLLLPDVASLARQVHTIKSGWIAQSGSSTPDFSALVRGLAAFITPYGAFIQEHDTLSGPGAILMGSLSAVSAHLETGRSVPQPAFFEVATLLLVVEDTLGLQDGTDFESLSVRADLIARRVSAALSGDAVLRSLPQPVWSRRRLSRMASGAVSIAVSEVKSDLAFVVDVVDEFFMRDAAAARPQYKEVRDKVLMDAQVLRTLGQPTAAAIMDEVYKDLVVMTHPAAPSADSREFSRLTQALAGVQAFLDSFGSGDHDAGRLLDPALATLSLSHSLDKGITEFSPAVPAFDQSVDAAGVEAAVSSIVVDHEVNKSEPAVQVSDVQEVYEGKTQDELEDQQAQVAEAFRNFRPWTDHAEDRELVDAFVEEALAVFERLESARIACIENATDREALIELRRQYHTIKGSGRMSGLWGIGEYAAHVELRLNEARDAEEAYTDELDRVIEISAGRLSEFLGELSREGWVRVGPLHQRELLGVISSSYPPTVSPEAEQANAERLAAEQADAERLAAEQAAADRLAAEQADAERLAAEQAAADRLAAEQAEAERLAAEQADAERLAAEQANAERLAAEQADADRLAAEQAEAERLAAEQADAERLAAEQAEAERLAAEQADAERLAAEQADAERLAAEQANAERLAAEQAEAKRLAAEQADAERLAAEQAEAERLAAEQADAERLAAEQADAERLAAEQAEAERLAAEQADAERLAAEQADAERLAAEQAEDDDSSIAPIAGVEDLPSYVESVSPEEVSLDTVMSDDTAMEDILLDLRTHRDNMRSLMSGGSFDVSMLNWSVHTLASLARGLGHERFRAFCKTLERKIEGDVDAQQSGLPLSQERVSTLMSLSAVVLEKTEALLFAPRATLDWDTLDASAETTLASMAEGSPFGEADVEVVADEDKMWDEVNSRISSIVDHFGALQSLFNELSKLRK